MKIETFKRPHRDNTLRLHLEETPVGVLLKAVSAEGHNLPGGAILSIIPSGIMRHSVMGGGFGLPLGKQGRVELVGEVVLPVMSERLAELMAKCQRVIEGKSGHTPVLANGCEVVYMDELKELFEHLGQQ